MPKRDPKRDLDLEEVSAGLGWSVQGLEDGGRKVEIGGEETCLDKRTVIRQVGSSEDRSRISHGSRDLILSQVWAALRRLLGFVPAK